MAKQLVNLSSKIVMRNDTFLNWNTINPILLKGEIGIVTDSTPVKFKIGNGVLTWKALNYANSGMVIMTTPPSASDNSYDIGTLYLVSATQKLYYLSNIDASKVAEWQNIVISSDMDDYMKIGTYANLTGAGNATGKVNHSLKSDKLANLRSILLSGDVSGSAAFDGSANAAITATLKPSGATAGTYTKVTIDAKGLVSKGETLGISDIPRLPNSSIEGLGTAAVLNTGLAAGNIPVLGASGKLPDGIIPNLAIGDVFEVASASAMLALTTAQKGDICIRSDVNKTFVLSDNTPTVSTAWKELKTPTDTVISVNGKIGAVSLITSDLSEGTNLYYTQARFDTAFTAKTTNSLKEGTNNLYYTNARVQTFLESTDNVFVLNGGNAAAN